MSEGGVILVTYKDKVFVGYSKNLCRRTEEYKQYVEKHNKKRTLGRQVKSVNDMKFYHYIIDVKRPELRFHAQTLLNELEDNDIEVMNEYDKMKVKEYKRMESRVNKDKTMIRDFFKHLKEAKIIE